MNKYVEDYLNGAPNNDVNLEWLLFLFLFDDLTEPHQGARALMYYADFHAPAKFVLDAMLAMAED